MNKTEVQQTGGFPLETDTLDALQNAYSIFNALGELAGNLAIISGCITTGSTVSDGVVYVKGEVFNFRGGTKSSYVIIKEDISTRVFEDGQSKVVYKNRYATFGSASTKYAWSSFKFIKSILELDAEKENKLVVTALTNRVTTAETNISKKEDKTVVAALTATVNGLAKKVMPVGGIIIWSGSTSNLPIGWVLCNGSNGAPDLRNRFVVGAGGAYNVGDKGGADSVKLTENEMPSHNHSGSVYIAPHKHKLPKSVPAPGGSLSNLFTNKDNSGHSLVSETSYSSSQTASITTNNKGGNQAHENRPPYYALAYIMFKG